MTLASAFSALLDPDRLMVAGALVGSERTTAELQARTGLKEREVLRAVGALRQAGLVEAVDGGYTLPISKLQELASESSVTAPPMDPYIGFGMTDEERHVLSRFFQGRTLLEVPAARAKRLVVLERLALEFDLGQRYSEARVNEVLRGFHVDYVALRRYLVDEGLLDREAGEYWRSGGRFDSGSAD